MPRPILKTATSIAQAAGFQLLSFLDLRDRPIFGTAAALNVPATAGAAAGSTEAVRGDDPRLARSFLADSKANTAAVSVTNNTVATLATFNLAAGNWRLSANVVFLGTGATVQKLEASITPGNGLFKDAADNYACSLAGTSALTGEVGSLSMGPVIVTVPSGGAALKLTARPFFTVGTVTAYHTFRAEFLGA